MSQQDNVNDIGPLGRQEILTGLILIVFVGFIIIVASIVYLILSNPEITKTLVIYGDVNIGKFVEQFQEMIPAFLTLLGVAAGATIARRRT